MLISEIFHSGTVDNESMDDAARMAAKFMFAIEFGHEPGLEKAFTELFQLPAFKVALEKEFTNALRKTISGSVRQSQIPPGQGWVDDFIVSVATSSQSLNVTT